MKTREKISLTTRVFFAMLGCCLDVVSIGKLGFIGCIWLND